MKAAQFIDRLKQLQDWLVSVGACKVCALDMAHAQAERESGIDDARAVPSKSCRRGDGAACFAAGRRRWKELPAADRKAG